MGKSSHLLQNVMAIVLATSALAPSCQEGRSRMDSFSLVSSAFKNEGSIPTKYTCEGDDTSPELGWNNPPEKTESFALIMEDPDAPRGTFVHWVAWNIDKNARKLDENIQPKNSALRQGMNSAAHEGYKGPCPPTGTHRYFFRLFALDKTLNLPDTTTKEDLNKAMAGHILGGAVLMGKYIKVR